MDPSLARINDPLSDNKCRSNLAWFALSVMYFWQELLCESDAFGNKEEICMGWQFNNYM